MYHTQLARRSLDVVSISQPRCHINVYKQKRASLDRECAEKELGEEKSNCSEKPPMLVYKYMNKYMSRLETR